MRLLRSVSLVVVTLAGACGVGSDGPQGLQTSSQTQGSNSFYAVPSDNKVSVDGAAWASAVGKFAAQEVWALATEDVSTLVELVIPNTGSGCMTNQINLYPMDSAGNAAADWAPDQTDPESCGLQVTSLPTTSSGRLRATFSGLLFQVASNGAQDLSVGKSVRATFDIPSSP